MITWKISAPALGLVSACAVVISVRNDTSRRSPEPQAHAAQSDVSCLATAMYFEARGEPEVGQMAVGRVILNRVADHGISLDRLRRRLPERQSQERLPVLLRLRSGPRQDHGHSYLQRDRGARANFARMRDLLPGAGQHSRGFHPLPRRFGPAVLVLQTDLRGPGRTPHLLPGHPSPDSGSRAHGQGRRMNVPSPG